MDPYIVQSRVLRHQFFEALLVNFVMEFLSFMSDFAPQFSMTDYGEEGVGIDRDVVARKCLIFTESREAVRKDELHACCQGRKLGGGWQCDRM